MSTNAKVLARLSAAVLLGWLTSTDARSQQAEVKVSEVNTKVDVVEVVTLQAGDAYGFNDATLSDEGKVTLDQVLKALKGEYVHRVDVSGYTDRIGDEAYNVDLSRKRAQSASDYLVESGIPAERIKITAMGSADPIMECDDKTGDDLITCLAPNRRTEIRFLYPRAQFKGIVEVSQKLSDAAGEYVGIYTAKPVQSTTFANKAIEVFMNGCRSDIETYCKDVTPGEQRLLACVYAYDDKISDGCKGSALDALLLIKTDIAQANFIGKLCGSDIVTHCGDVEPGDGRIEACLMEKRSTVSETCRGGLGNMPRL